MGNLKVLHINTLDTQGGASQVAIDLISQLDAGCHLVTLKRHSGNSKVIKLKKNYVDWLFFLIDKVNWRLGMRTPIRTLLTLDNEFNYTYEKLIKLKEYREANVIHLHNIHGGFFDFITLEKIANEKKIIWTLHDMWAITGGEAHTFENENYKKGIATTPYINIYPLLNPILDRRQYFLEKKKYIYEKIYQSIIFVPVSHWLNSNFKQAFVYNSHLRLQVIHNGIDTNIFVNKNKRLWSKPRLLFFNLVNPFKGSQVFAEILTKVSVDFELYIVGEKLKAKSSSYFVNYIESREVLSELYNEVDFLIFPSLAENFPLTLLEAMSCGVCVISSNVGGISEMLDETCGYLFDPKSKDECLQKINEALSNLDKAHEKGLLAKIRVQKKFSLAVACQEYLNLYHDTFKYKYWNNFKSINLVENSQIEKDKFFNKQID